ncbi:hypothetical protein CAOG_05108 [Capsaspora owczarzaki ATCC 30864]|uniref:hypothetical protein n=1 Tax=Capsaspora owczarzaki (strain ATCC 30864) TaxID=595528 RepID=UPI0003523E60|nr:hypothetical protein CAOG_05108 [Capsaspora owczarzaki ATCC 30864]|eukprot:XP_004346793.2 hypothetical protein CAOG_05108 [Capsaspora owczarzaki ATCC 30864]
MEFDAPVDDVDVERFEREHNDLILRTGSSTDNAKFNYAWCLVKSRFRGDNRRGIEMFQDLLASGDRDRECLFFIALGYYRLGEYPNARVYVKRLLQIEPRNRQALQLDAAIDKLVSKDTLIGAAVVGGLSVIVGLGIMLLKKK